MPTTKTDVDQQTRVLLAIMVLAFCLRIWGIWNASSTDEYNEVFEALRVCSGNLNFERWFKRFYLYVLAVEYGLYFAAGWVMDIFQSPADFAIKIVRDMEPLFILGRTTSAFLGTGSVFMVFLIGKTLFNKNVGLLAALFLCLDVVNIELSHYARVDASLCFLTLTTFYYIARIYKNQQASLSRFYVLAGIFFGCAFQNKPQAIVLLFPFAYAHARGYQFKDLAKAMLARELFIFIGGFVFGFMLGNPAVLFAPLKFVNSFLGLGRVYTTAVNMSQPEHIGFIAYGIYLFRELGVLMSGLALYSLAAGLFTRKPEMHLLFCFMVPFYLLMGASKYMVSVSYMVPFMPFLYLLIAANLQQAVAIACRMGDGQCRRFGQADRRRLPPVRKSGRSSEDVALLNGYPKTTPALVLITAVLLAQPLYNVGRFELSLAGPNTRIVARDWIEKNIPFDSKILMDSGKTINSTAPRISMNAASIERLLAAKMDDLEKGTLTDTTNMVDEKSLRYFELLLKTVPKEAYDITSTGFGLQVKSIDYYLANNFEYLVISQQMKKARTNPIFASNQPEVAEFYSALDRDKRVKLLHLIAPSTANSGDSFFIYKLNS